MRGDDRGPIGVFDSGVGGLSVVREIRARYPKADILYFGDTARVPYGNKSADTVIRYSIEIADFLVKRGISTLVVACNTSSALALDTLKERMSIPVLGVIAPGARGGLRATRNGNIGLIGTRATVGSGAYAKELRSLDPSVRLHAAACPLFVPLVEEGWSDDPVAEEVARRYLGRLLEIGIDTLILGCTHYPALMGSLQRVVGNGVTLVSSAREAAAALEDGIPRNEGRGIDGTGTLRVFVSDTGTHFQRVGESLLAAPVPLLRKIEEERLVSP